jgi:iron complex outermembrane recepter protein
VKQSKVFARSVAAVFACSPFGAVTLAHAQESIQSEATPIAEVIVSAQRFESTVLRTPIAVTAVSGDALRASGVLDPTRLGAEVPNLSIDRGNGLQITIRGVTSSDGTEKGDPSAAFLLDGIYIARPQVQEVSFFDITRVEVLRGPQGTLYGRNTTAGVVNVITNQPTREFDSAVNTSIGDFGTQQFDAMVNVPLNEVWALRVAGAYDKRDSYQTRLGTDQQSLDPFKKNTTARIQALGNFSEDVSLLLRFDYSDLEGKPGGLLVRATNFFSAADLASDPLLQDPIRVTGDGDSDSRRRTNYTQLTATDQRNNTWGASAELSWDLGPLALTYIGSYREFDREEDSNVGLIDGAPAVDTLFLGQYSQNSQELRFATTSQGPFQSQFGVYWFKERSDIAFYYLDLAGAAPVFGFPQDPTISESYAVFGQGTYSFTDQLRLTLGVRYSHDDKSRVGATVSQQTMTFNPATDTRLQNSAETTSEKTTLRVGMDYDLGDTSMLYGVVSTGYKAGGFNDGCEADTVTNGVPCNQPRPVSQLYYDPETLTAYEVGYKTRTAGGRIQLNAAVFHYDYKNLQLSTLFDFGGGPAQTTTNAAEASVDGIELEASFAPSTRNRFDLAAAYLDGKYEEYFPLGAGSAPDYAGRSLDRSPDFTLTAGYTHVYPLSNGGQLSANVRERWSDEYVLTVFATPRQYTQPSYNRTDVSLTYAAPDDRWYVQAFGTNLEDEVLVTGVDTMGNVTPSEPRLYGVRAGWRY